MTGEKRHAGNANTQTVMSFLMKLPRFGRFLGLACGPRAVSPSQKEISMRERKYHSAEGASGKPAKSNRCRARGRSMARQRGLSPFFPSGAFPEEPRGAVFHSYFHGRDPFIEGCNAARCRNRWRITRYSLPLFPPRMCSPRSGLHLYTTASYIYVLFFFFFFSFFAAMPHFINAFRCDDQSVAWKNTFYVRRRHHVRRRRIN